MTSIYCAGKIAKNDWRNLRGQWGSDGGLPEPWWPTLPGHAHGFDYVGPFFMGDDHGCGHGPSTHGCGQPEGMCGEAYPTPGRDGVLIFCLDAIARCDIFFAWLDGLTAYGTLVEIGYARALRKQIIIATPSPPGRSRTHDDEWENDGLSDLWFAFECASRVITASSPNEAIATLARDTFMRVDSPIEKAFWVEHLRQGLPPLTGLVSQHELLDGKYRLDFALPDRKIGVELDGYAYHSSPEAFTRDRARQRNIERAGWRIIRFSGSEINTDVTTCVKQAADLVAAWS